MKQLLSKLTILILLVNVGWVKQTAAQQISDEERMEWWTDARFGMFIHWGPYSRLAGEWNGRQLPVGENAEWIMQKFQIPVEEYRKAKE